MAEAAKRVEEKDESYSVEEKAVIEAIEVLNKHGTYWTTIELYDSEESYGVLLVPKSFAKKVHTLIDIYKDEVDPEGYSDWGLVEFLRKNNVPVLFIPPEGEEAHYF